MLKHNLQQSRPSSRGLAWLIPLLWPATAWAGMPSVVQVEVWRRSMLTDTGRIRFEAISLFLFVLFVAALVVQWLWNRLARDFPRLPRIGLVRALGVVGLWGLLCLVVLTMIAAAREMMTPGVWQKQGLLYRIPDDSPPPAKHNPPVHPEGQR
jgi:hypothetical protein